MDTTEIADTIDQFLGKTGPAFIEKRLLDHNVQFKVLRHEPVYTSQDAARVRGVALASGAKALVCKVEDRFVMFVMPADRRLANKKIRRLLGIRKLRFAARDERTPAKNKTRRRNAGYRLFGIL